MINTIKITNPAIQIVAPVKRSSDTLIVELDGGREANIVFAHLAVQPEPTLGIVVNPDEARLWAGKRAWETASNNKSRSVSAYVDRDSTFKTSAVTFDIATAQTIALVARNADYIGLLVDGSTNTLEITIR